jgi:hypothetical protein
VRVRAEAKQRGLSAQLVAVTLGMIELERDNRILVEEALDLLSPSGQLPCKRQCWNCTQRLDDWVAGLLDQTAKQLTKLPTTLVGRTWLWTKLIEAVHTEVWPTVLIVADSGLTIAAVPLTY